MYIYIKIEIVSKFHLCFINQSKRFPVTVIVNPFSKALWMVSFGQTHTA